MEPFIEKRESGILEMYPFLEKMEPFIRKMDSENFKMYPFLGKMGTGKEGMGIENDFGEGGNL